MTRTSCAALASLSQIGSSGMSRIEAPDVGDDIAADEDVVVVGFGSDL